MDYCACPAASCPGMLCIRCRCAVADRRRAAGVGAKGFPRRGGRAGLLAVGVRVHLKRRGVRCRVQMMKVKEESEKAGLKLNIHKTKIMVSGSVTS